MTKTTLIVGHKTLTLDDLDPSKSPAFSPNLHAYLKKRGHFFKDGGLLQAVFTVKPGSRVESEYGASTLLLGYLDDNYLIGVRLIEALCQGAKARSMAHPIANGLDRVDNFWKSYLKKGRCVIDPDHQDHFLTDRFLVEGDHRTCRWCGHQQTQVSKTRVEHYTVWESKAQE